jgi:hypothetical protein
MHQRGNRDLFTVVSAIVLRGVMVMTSKAVIGIAFATGCALAFGAIPPAKAQLYTNGPQANPGDYDYSLAARNNAESAQYERLLQANPGFRQARMQRECGPITDP